MLTISQLAAYVGVTVRAVRHYHAKGLLPEPERDHSGYRRYDAAAVSVLIRIRTLAEAGVPLSRVQELLTADEDDFAAAIEEIDRRLRAEIRERQRHRERVAQLAAGDRLALPPEAVDWDADDPRLPAVADRLVAMFEEDVEQWNDDQTADFTLGDELFTLLDEVFLNAVPCARTLLRLLEERGWKGWTQLERISPPL